jgi:hypothetical protein
LPTPRIGAVVPLFANLDAEATAGGFVLFLDHGWYDMRTSGGLRSELEVEIIVEESADKKRRAVAVGRDAIRHAGTGRNLKAASIAFQSAAIFGLTLEPLSPAPRFPFSAALFDVPTTDPIIEPSSLAHVRCRAKIGGSKATSDWSASFLVQFHPDRSLPEEVVCRRQGQNQLLLSAKASDPRFDRLKARLDDSTAPRADWVQLRDGVVALAVKVMTGANGKSVIRMVGNLAASKKGGNIIELSPIGSWTIEAQAPTHIKLVDTRIVRELKPASDSDGLNERSLFGAQKGDEPMLLATCLLDLIPIT